MISDCWEGWDEEAWTDCWGEASILIPGPPITCQMELSRFHELGLTVESYYSLNLSIES